MKEIKEHIKIQLKKITAVAFSTVCINRKQFTVESPLISQKY